MDDYVDNQVIVNDILDMYVPVKNSYYEYHKLEDLELKLGTNISTQYRLRLESICRCMNKEQVPLEDMIWQETCQAHTLPGTGYRKQDDRLPKIFKRDTDDFLNKMGLGDRSI